MSPFLSSGGALQPLGPALVAVLAPRLADAVAFPVGGESAIHVNDLPVPHRCPMWFSQDRNPTSTVIHLHVGQWDHHPSAPAHAEH